MNTETESSQITPVGGNVFVDLGFEPDIAAALKAESQRIISQRLASKDSSTPEWAGRIDAKPD